ncbi:glycosyltransferase family 39 protein [Candidatus Uhrbacteria bacterium]|nr:glycosyltransferase family 39 protein [Candidatus Uhrbacteria bacterium]
MFQRVPKTVWYAVIAALILRLIGLIWVHVSGNSDRLLYGDGIGYLELARNLVQGHGFALWREGRWIIETFRTPGLPLLLIPFTFIPNGLSVYQFVLAIGSSFLLPWLGYEAGNRLFGERTGKIAAWLLAVEPLMVFFSWLALTEIPFLILGLSAIILAYDARAYRRADYALFSGVCAAAAVYVRPGNYFLMLLGYGMLIVADIWKRRYGWRLPVISLLLMIALLIPWMGRMYAETGSFSLSATGWRNVYTDYLASIRAVEHGTTFWDEKEKLKLDANFQFGLSRYELNNPANGAVLRDYALKEIVQRPVTVIKLQSLIFVSFFTNDSYSSYLMRFGFLSQITGRISPTYVILTEGVSGIGKIAYEMQRQWFVPVWGRVLTLGLLFTAIAGAWKYRRKPVVWWCIVLIAWTALASSAIGLGVEARLRISIMPLIFFLAGAAFERKQRL